MAVNININFNGVGTPAVSGLPEAREYALLPGFTSTETLLSRAKGKGKKKSKKCEKGQVCGLSCIAKTKTCIANMTTAQLMEHDRAKKKAAKGGGASNETAKPQTTPLAGTLAELTPDQIKADPKRFQYKIIGESTKTGEVGSLSGVQRYDPNLAGIIQVWQDPADGQTYVVNGHNRLALANRLGAEKVAVS